MSTIELSLSVVCVCFPAMKILLNKYFPSARYVGSTGGVVQSIRLTDLSSASTERRPLRRLGKKISSLFTNKASSTKASPQWSGGEKRVLSDVEMLASLPRHEKILGSSWEEEVSMRSENKE